MTCNGTAGVTATEQGPDITAVYLKVGAAGTDVGRTGLTVTSAEHIVKSTAVNDGHQTHGSCCITAAEYTADRIGATIDMHGGFLGARGQSILGSVVSLVTSTEHLVYGVVGICSVGRRVVVARQIVAIVICSLIDIYCDIILG